LNCIITVDDENGGFLAKSIENPGLVGRGDSFYAAVDDLEEKLKEAQTLVPAIQEENTREVRRKGLIAPFVPQ
jgi:predicted RNase H-like HicB family nuclease